MSNPHKNRVSQGSLSATMYDLATARSLSERSEYAPAHVGVVEGIGLEAMRFGASRRTLHRVATVTSLEAERRVEQHTVMPETAVTFGSLALTVAVEVLENTPAQVVSSHS